MRIPRSIIAAAILFAAGIAQAQSQWTATILPSSPRYLEPVFVRIDPPLLSSTNIYGAQVSMSGTNIVVRYQTLPEIGDSPHDVMLGRFPSGSYDVLVVSGDVVQASAHFTVGPAPVSSAYPGNAPSVNYTDMWWNPAESGMGISIIQGPTNQLLAQWFAYDANGNPIWYSLQPGQWTATNVYSVFTGPIFRTSGPYFGGGFDPSKVHATQVGTGTLTFSDYAHAEFRYTVDGLTSARSIEREPIE